MKSKPRYARYFVISLIFLALLCSFGKFTCTAAGETGAKVVCAKRYQVREYDSAATGYLPPPVDLSYLHTRAVPGMLTAPAHFDWREKGRVTPVKNQGFCGCCYAFAAIANLESRVLIQSDIMFDFSENNVKECEWFGASCSGGNDWMVANFLTTAGTVLETCDPYIPGDVQCNTACLYQKTLVNWGVISGPIPAPVDVLKSYIAVYGPVYSTLYVGDGDAWRGEFAAYDGSYVLYHDDYETPNHAVLIVGWDDDLPHPGGTGAWIVKNSWGTAWGGPCGHGDEGGYFTIAYGSAGIGSNSSFAAEVVDFSPTDTLLHYDEGGFGGCVGILDRQTVWGLCKFAPAVSINVRQVEFWTADATVDVDIYVYDDFDGVLPSNLLAFRPDNAFDHAGYHSVPLDMPLRVKAGEDVYVVLKITTAVSNFPLVYDSSGPRAPGCCYMSSDGTDFNEFLHGDLGIRLRAGKEAACAGVGDRPEITRVVDVPKDDGGYVNLTWTRTARDTGQAGGIRWYRVWRKRRETLESLLSSAGFDGPKIAGPYQHGIEGPAWEIAGAVAADGSCQYEFTASTTCDRTPTDSCWSYFCVTAHTGIPGEHFDSPVVRGYSIDNGDLLTRPDDTGSSCPGPGDFLSGAITLHRPNPNPSRTGFSFVVELTRPQVVTASIYDVLGREQAQIVRGLKQAGSHTFSWTPGKGRTPAVTPGIYFLRLTAERETLTERLVLID